MSYMISEPRFALERRIPLALVFAIMLHLAAALIWAAQLDTRVARIERDVDRIGQRIESFVSHPREGGDPFANRLPPTRE